MPLQVPVNPLKKIFNICLVLTIFFFSVNIILGTSLKTLKRDLKVLELFLVNAEAVKPNFEESLNLYTQGTQEAIEYVGTLRPDTETEYINFISSVEVIGQELALNIDLESLESPKPDSLGDTLRYRLEFFGSQNDLLTFLEELEALPYYIRVDEVRFESLERVTGSQKDLAPNIVLTIQLYVR